MRALIAVVALLALCVPSIASAEDARLAFVTEVIRGWGNAERLREQAAEEMVGSDQEKMMACIRIAERYDVELSTQVSILEKIKLDEPFASLPERLAKLYREKIVLYEAMSEGCEAILAGPKAGVDLDAIVARSPKLTALLESADHLIFEVSPAVFGVLVDQVPDAKGKLSKLVLTAAERKKLIGSINQTFGKTLEQEKQPWLVCAAWEIRAGLQMNFTSRP
jgi:hypothetical protein